MSLWEAAKPRIERRRHERRAMQLWVHCAELRNGKPTRSFTHLTEDLSAGGLAMRSSRAYKVDQPLMTTLLLPPPHIHIDRINTLNLPMNEYLPVGILSRVVWCASAEKDYTRIGVEFFNISENGLQTLKDFFAFIGLDTSNAPHLH